MATKQFYATGSFKYGTRMLSAGDPVQMDAPTARLYAALGKISPTRVRSKAVARSAQDIRDDLAVLSAAPVATAPKRKAAKRRTAKKAK
jgi:hypothetical protein